LPLAIEPAPISFPKSPVKIEPGRHHSAGKDATEYSFWNEVLILLEMEITWQRIKPGVET